MTRRRDDIDRLRGAAVFMMFFVHTETAWLAPQWSKGLYSFFVDEIGGLVAPTFIALAGLGAVLAGRKAGPARQEETRRRLIKRGLQIALLGFGLALLFAALSGFRSPIAKLWRADILPCIGLSMAAMAWLCYPLVSEARKWISLALFFLLPLLALALVWADIGAYLPGPLAVQLTVRNGSGSFPVVPYAAWLALGFFLGAVWPKADASAVSERRFFFWLGAGAVACYVASLGLAWVFFHFDIFAPPGGRPQRGMLHAFLNKATFVLILLVISRLSVAVLPRRGPEILVLWGRTSLTAYCVHLLFIYHVGGPALMRRLPPLTVFLATLGLAAVMFGICYAYAHRREWLARLRSRS